MLSPVELSLAAIGGHSAPGQGGVVFLRILGLVFVVMGWLPVLNPEMQVSWKGGNHAPMSQKGKWAVAVATTSWCLAVWGVAPMFCAALFALSVVCGMGLSRQDRLRYSKHAGIPAARPIDPQQLWAGFSAFVSVCWILSLYCVVRDLYWPQVRRDDEILRWMARILLGIMTVFAVALYATRPKKSPPLD